MKKILSTFALLTSATVLLAGCNNNQLAESMTYEETYSVFVDNIMHDQIEQLQSVSDWNGMLTDSDIQLTMNNEFAIADIGIKTLAMMKDWSSSWYNAFDVMLDSELLQMSGAITLSHFSDVVSTYYRLDAIDVDMWWLLAGNLTYVDLMKEQLKALAWERYKIDQETLLTDTANASYLSEWLKQLPLDVYEWLSKHQIFDVEEKSDDGYKVNLSATGMVWFLEEVQGNDYVKWLFDTSALTGDMSALFWDVARINETTDMFLKVVDADHVDLFVQSRDDAVTPFSMTIGHKGISLDVWNGAWWIWDDLHVEWLEAADDEYAIQASLVQSWMTVIEIEWTHKWSLTEDSMSTVVDLDVGVANALLNLPIESDFVEIKVTMDSTSVRKEWSTTLLPPANFQAFDDFMGWIAGEYVEQPIPVEWGAPVLDPVTE